MVTKLANRALVYTVVEWGQPMVFDVDGRGKEVHLTGEESEAGTPNTVGCPHL